MTTAPGKNQGWLPYADGMRVCATLAVLLIHVCGPGQRPSLTANPEGWWLCNALSSASQWAVPVFLLLSGALLLAPDKEESHSTFYGKRFLRVGIPLLFWTGVYLTYLHFTRSGGLTIKTLWSVAMGAPFYHLYFLFIIAGLYLVTPVLRPFVRQNPPRTVLLFAVCALVVAALHRWLTMYFKGEFFGTMFSLFVPYAGYYLAGTALRYPTRRGAAVLLSFLGILTGSGSIALYEWLRASKTIAADSGILFLFTGYLSPVVMALSLSAFVYLRELFVGTNKALTFVSRASLGIYLIHPLVQAGLAQYGIQGNWQGTAIGVPVTFVLLFLGSFLISALLGAIPGLRRIVGQ